jgi:CRP-like cAMP-binding protein
VGELILFRDLATSMFQDLNNEDCRKLQKLGIKKTFGENEQIFAEGEKADFLPIVCQGTVKMVRYPEPGKELIVGTFGEGEIFAIAPALDGKTFPATAIAMKKTQLLILPRPAFVELMKESNEFSAVLMTKMCGLLRNRTATVHILAMSSADHRVGNVLLNLANGCNANLPMEIPFRRQEIAEMSGLTIETAIRSVRKLEKRGFLKIVNRKIVLENLDPLKKLLQS